MAAAGALADRQTEAGNPSLEVARGQVLVQQRTHLLDTPSTDNELRICKQVAHLRSPEARYSTSRAPICSRSASMVATPPCQQASKRSAACFALSSVPEKQGRKDIHMHGRVGGSGFHCTQPACCTATRLLHTPALGR